MKKLILIIAIAMASCLEPERRVEVNCLYAGGVIYGKHDFRNFDGSVVYDIKYKGEVIKYVHAWPLDFGYEIGDIINKPCRP